MRSFHANWSYVVVVTNLAAGLIGLAWARRQATVPRGFWYLLGAGLVALVVQVSLGLLLTQTYGRPGLHMFYGFVVLIAAIIGLALRGQDTKRNVTVLSGAALFIGAVSIRAMIAL